jgi:flagellar hook-basal body complex protein FliE
MKTTFANAIAAYNDAAKAIGGQPLDAEPQKKGSGFAAMLERAVNGAIEISETGEQTSLKAVAGKAELSDVVTAVTNAEVTLQTVVAIRDRVVQAYQDILRMPI